ncbi:hypothetical protein [Aegicerativicinus sediminis]|uniref:hypothetical protein n=1 Tax=Aegicerativicinus sediminis TaxID=2893202 RepID=UPI001E3027CE|nr:hypothetical protein [Aegicerativicinus sediminis]
MKFIFIGLIFIVILYSIILAKNQLLEDNKTKPFTSVSALMLMAIIISIFLSTTIALNAEISASSGHGGFIYIIYPSLYGIIILMGYLVSLGLIPKWKYALGISCVLLNIVIGLIYALIEI